MRHLFYLKNVLLKKKNIYISHTYKCELMCYILHIYIYIYILLVCTH